MEKVEKLREILAETRRKKKCVEKKTKKLKAMLQAKGLTEKEIGGKCGTSSEKEKERVADVDRSGEDGENMKTLYQKDDK